MKAIILIKDILNTAIIPVFLFYVSLRFSQKERMEYKFLKWPDGRKCIILFMVAIFYTCINIVGFFTDTNPATKKDVKEAVGDGSAKVIDAVKQSGDEIWEKINYGSSKNKWSLESSWDSNDFGLMIQKTKIVMLADQTMWYLPNGGDYAAYEKLWSLKNSDNFLRSFADDQLLRINSILRFANAKVREVPLCKHGKNIDNYCIEVESETDFSVDNVLPQLSHPTYWTSRAKSAYLLYFLTFEKVKGSRFSWGDILDNLCVVFSGSNDVHKSDNLLVRYMAWESFRKHTGFCSDTELFNAQKAKEWWGNKENRQKVLAALENGQKSPFARVNDK